MRKAFVFFSILLLLTGGVFLFRHQLLMIGTKTVLNRSFPDAIVYKGMTTKEGRVSVRQLHAHQDNVDLTLDGVEFGLNFKEVLKHPRPFFDLARTKVANWIQILAPMKQYGVDLSIHQGVLQLDEYRYYFQLKNGEKKHEIATLSISHDPNFAQHPFIVIQFHLRGEQVIAQISVEQVASDRFLKLASFAFPELLDGFENASGIVQVHANAIFEKNGQIEEFSTRFACENFEIHYPKLQFAIQMEHFVGNVNYPEGINHPGFPIWKRMQCGLFLEKGNMVFGENLSLSNLEGSLALDPRQDPVLDLNGELVGHDVPLALHLGGKGSVYDDRAYWLEFALNLDDQKGTECGAFLSICRPEADSLVLQLEAQNLLPSQVEMLKCYFARSNPNLHCWEIQQGSFGGKLVALFEGRTLAHFELQDLIGENITFAAGQHAHHFTKINGEGRLFDAMNFNIDLSASEFFSLISPEFKEVFAAYRPEDRAHLSLTTQFGKNEVNTSAHVDFLETEQTLQFGFKSLSFFPTSLDEITEGWARSEKLNHLMYGPFVRMMDEDLEIYGDVDIVAAYEGNKLDLALQVNEFLSKYPLFDLKATAIGEKGKTHGRAKFVYDFKTDTFHGMIPLREAKAYDRQFGLYLRDLDTDLTFSSKECHASVKQANVSFDGMKLLTNAQFEVTYKDGITISSFLGKLPLKTDREFFLNILTFNRESCEAKVFDGKEELAHFSGSKDGGWKGSLKVNPLKDPLNVVFNWDPLTNLAELDAQKEGLHLHCTKQGTKIAVEKLAMNEFLFQGVFAKQNEAYILSHFEMQRPDFYLEGAGTFSVDLPQKHTSFGIKGSLSLEAQAHMPVPLTLKTSRPFKLAYSPSLGLALSELGMQGEGCRFNIGHLEHHHANEKTSVHHCTFDLTKELLGAFIEAKVLPPLLDDFYLFKGAAGNANWATEKGMTQFKGRFHSEKGDFDLIAEWKNKGGKFALNESEKEDTLTFQTRFEQDGLYFDSVKGSLCGLSVDLKKRKKDELKGSLTLDCAKFDKLLDLPLSRYVALWKTGGKYQLDGVFTSQQRLFDWSFKGKIKGHGFEWGGVQLRSMEAKVDLESGRLSLENLDVTDDAGKMWVGEGLLVRGTDGQWNFSLPFVEIRGFQPGFLLKTGQERKGGDPLMIKAATLRDVRGKIDDLSSITADGTLRFNNISKKGGKQHPKNLPTTLLRQMGLDEGILIPASGEMRYSIQNGRCYLKGLESVISDRRRSEFQAPRNGSIGYIDFDGNLFLDLQVKQNVVRSISSPLTVKVRGSWEEPQFTIK